MDDMKISLSVPATIYSFGETKNLTQNQYVTHAKLKIFYVGQTEDRRVFTKQFSDQLLQTLPGTPVVAYYNEETDDFNGHNPVQYVFGYVPETATIGYAEENGRTFAVSDVLLFTGRDDNIGMVANKIIGKSHSLELDPATVEYTIVRANNKLESITFTKGHFIGLSVLGDNEQPAFSGSAFFSASDIEVKTFVDSFQEFKREVEFYKSGGNEMNEENILPTLESPITEAEVITTAAEIEEKSVEVYIEDDPMDGEDDKDEPMDDDKDDPEDKEPVDYVDTTSETTGDSEAQAEEFILDPYQEKEKRVYAALLEMYPNVQFKIKQMDDQWVTYEEYVEDQNGYDEKYYRIAYDDRGIEAMLIGGPIEVFKRYLTMEEIDRAFAQPMPEEQVEVEMSEQISEPVANAESFEGLEDDRKETTKQQEEDAQKAAYTAALNQAERQELNEYRQKAKFELIESYVDLGDDIKETMRQEHEKFTIEELDMKLAYELVKHQRQFKKSDVKVFTVPTVEQKPETVADWINRYKDKK